MDKIPVYIGVTGHQNIPIQDYATLKQMIKEQLSEIQRAFPDSPLIMLNNLAKGADFLCFEAAKELGIDVHVILPYLQKDYQLKYQGEDLKRFEQYLTQAAIVTHCQKYNEDPSTPKDVLLREAGFEIARTGNILIALWDGVPCVKEGPSTGNVVDYFLNQKSAFEVLTKRLIHIKCRRNTDDEENFTISVNDGEGNFAKLLKRINDVNRQVELEKSDNLRHSVRNLSAKAQQGYFRLLRCLAVACSMVVFTFLLYDEMESNLFLIVFSLLLTGCYLMYRREMRSLYHEDYLDYRMLSESLRVRKHLQMSGQNTKIDQLCTLSYKQNLCWIVEIINNLDYQNAEKQSFDLDTIKRKWLINQSEYHSQNAKKLRKMNDRNQRLSKTLFILSILLYTAVVIIEFVEAKWMDITFFDNMKASALMMHAGSSVTLRSLFKIVLGSNSAFALFLSGYYGKLSMIRSAEDSKRMTRLYQRVLERLPAKRDEEIKVILLELAREEILENESWYSYNKENDISINI